LHGGSILNEFFRYKEGRGEDVVLFLQHLRSLFPTQYFLVSDYYGLLGREGAVDSNELKHTLIHDCAQVVSGQGVPYCRRQDWIELYEKSGYKLKKQIEYKHKGMRCFLHVLEPKNEKE